MSKPKTPAEIPEKGEFSPPEEGEFSPPKAGKSPAPSGKSPAKIDFPNMEPALAFNEHIDELRKACERQKRAYEAVNRHNENVFAVQELCFKQIEIVRLTEDKGMRDRRLDFLAYIIRLLISKIIDDTIELGMSLDMLRYRAYGVINDHKPLVDFMRALLDRMEV